MGVSGAECGGAEWQRRLRIKGGVDRAGITGRVKLLGKWGYVARYRNKTAMPAETEETSAGIASPPGRFRHRHRALAREFPGTSTHFRSRYRCLGDTIHMRG